MQSRQDDLNRGNELTEPQPFTEDTALRAIVEGVEAETGEEFFPSLVQNLAAALRVQYAFVSEFSEDRLRFRARALWGRGNFLPPFEIPIAGTPCEAVLAGQASHHPARLQALFPADKGLVRWGAESYCGVPLLDASGTCVGHLAIMDDKPMPDGPRGLAIMRIFAMRARAEIERLRVEQALRLSEERLARILDSAMDAIITFDARRLIELFNDTAEKVFCCPAAKALGQPLDRFLTESFKHALDNSLEAFTQGSQTPPYVWAPGGLTARRADGREFPIEATIAHVEVSGQKLYTLIVRDIDERQRVEGELRQLHQHNEYLQEEIRSVHKFDEIVGQSRILQHEVLEKIPLVASTDASVLILGETGTGKELIARAVHAHSKRKDRPLVKVNCAALPSGLIESELFGHEKGAFTGATEKRLGRFELAHGGTLFLDEIGELPPDMQVKLLRVLQEREFERVGGSKTIRVDVRLITATNRDLTKSIAEGKFRQDLYYRLNVFPVYLPPLRERPEDIALLTHYFVKRYATKIGRQLSHVPRDVMQRLVAYAWPGNVRELENVIERAVILSAGPDLVLGREALPSSFTNIPIAVATQSDTSDSPEDLLTLEQAERHHIVSVLKQTQWRIDGQQGAARILNVHPSTLRSRMKKLGIQRSAEESS
jgi:formate hydrogenlyase transcriptional activator